MPAAPRAMVAGHVCLDVIPALRTPTPLPGCLAEVGPAEIRLGGCVANTGITLAGLGARVDLVTIVGTDLFGDTILRMLESTKAAKVTTQRTSTHATSYSIVLQPPGADRAFLHHVGANAVFDAELVDLAGIDLLHVGYPQLLPGLTKDGGRGLTGLLHRAKATGATSSVDFATLDDEAGAGGAVSGAGADGSLSVDGEELWLVMERFGKVGSG